MGERKQLQWMATLVALWTLGAAANESGAQPDPTLPGAAAHSAALRERLAAAVASHPAGWTPRTRHRLSNGTPRFTNRLALEASPYLQQHAHNPVDWYPWGDEAFAAAKRLGRPVFVSIGYSTCHWCHVMEEESFDDIETATLLNTHFIAIKVDREARPDVDAAYMSAVHTLGQRGGWPLSVWLTPDRKPFFGGTYFPKEDMPGRPGFAGLLAALHQVWTDERTKIDRQADALVKAVATTLAAAPATSTRLPPESLLRDLPNAYREAFDVEWGGLRGPTKFPGSLPVRLLLRVHRRGGDPAAREMAVRTLERMATGGLQDHVGGGFHRYATDTRWRVPHFEKMLYDNALLVMAYVEAWQATGRRDFADVARATLAYVAREMTDPAGGFYSATDADSVGPDGESEEGRFFTWTPAELEAALGDEAALAAEWFGVTQEGNLDGRTVLHIAGDESAVAAAHGIPVERLRSRLAAVRGKLFEVRSARPPPLRDEKIIAAWNGLMISAFARAGLALGDPDLVRRAGRAATFVLSMRESAGDARDGRLRRLSKAGRTEGPAFLEDYAFLIAGLLDLYEAEPELRWLEEALALQRVLDTHYADEVGGGYFRTGAGDEVVIAREKSSRDATVPSGNAVAALSLLRLAAYTGDDAHRERAVGVFSAFHDDAVAQPRASPELLLALDFALEPAREVLLVTPTEGCDGALLDVLRAAHLPNRILAVVREGPELDAHAALVPLLRFKKARAGRPTAYVCENRVCRFPTSDPAEFQAQLEAVNRYAARTSPAGP